MIVLKIVLCFICHLVILNQIWVNVSTWPLLTGGLLLLRKKFAKQNSDIADTIEGAFLLPPAA